MVNRTIPSRTFLLAGLLVLLASSAGAQAPPLQGQPAEQPPLAPLSATDPIVHKGLFTIDVVVTDAAGNPVSGLPGGDFTLIDNGQPARIRTLHDSLAATEPAPELIFVLDTVNLSPLQLTQAESAVSRFLRKNGGRLEFPCLLYRLTRDGLFSSLRPVTDGAILIDELEQKRSQLAVWVADRHEINLLGSWEAGSPRNRLSLRAELRRIHPHGSGNVLERLFSHGTE